MGDVLGEAAEAAPHALADRLERLEAGGAEGGVDADALGRAVVDGDEHRGLALAQGHGLGHVGPHITTTAAVAMVPSRERGSGRTTGRGGRRAWCERKEDGKGK